MAISDNMPPHKPMICFFVSFSLNNRTDITELRMIALPFTMGKNNWLGKRPESFKFKKFIPKVQIPQTSAKAKCFFVKFNSLKLFFARIWLYMREHIKATNKNTPASSLCTELWCIFWRTPMLPWNINASKQKISQRLLILESPFFSNDR